MKQIQMSKDLEKIIKEGFLEKQSRFMKSWRKRWFVLTPFTLYSFKQRKVYNSPTQILPLKTIVSIKTCDQQIQKQFTFKIDTENRSFYLGATSTIQKQQWIGQIGKAMVKLSAKQNENQ